MLKGKTEIELTDVRTGKKDKIIEHNLVTKAIEKLINTNTAFGSLGSLDFLKYVKGVFLIDENLDENSFILPYNCSVVGHSGNNESVKDIYGGTYNELESEVLQNGYKFVWDFGTNQANGVIKCVSLVPTIGGNTGFGFDFKQKSIKQFDPYSLISPGCYNKNTVKHESLTHICEDTGYNIYLTENVIKLKTYDLPNKKVKFLQGYNAIKNSEYSYITDKNYESYSVAFYKSGIYIICFNKDKSCSLYCIDKESHLITNEYNLDLLFSMFSDSEISSTSKLRIFINEGFAFLVFVDGYKIYKVNLENTSDIKIIKSEESLRAIGGFYNNRLISAYAILENDEFKYMYKGGDWSYSGNTIFIIGNINDEVGYYYGNGTNSSNFTTLAASALTYNNHFLSTINNLSTPITKTADKTMKVIYTITES